MAQWCRNIAILKVGLAGALESYKEGASVWEERRFCRAGELGDRHYSEPLVSFRPNLAGK